MFHQTALLVEYPLPFSNKEQLLLKDSLVCTSQGTREGAQNMEMDRGCPGGPKPTVDVQVLSEEGLPPKGFHSVLGLSSPQLPPECTVENRRLHYCASHRCPRAPVSPHL